MSSEQKNIWVAAADGDLTRIKDLVESHSVSPNAPDPFTYTPMHAAASYAQLDILQYLISQGGDVNITDEDGDTPLYTVETIEAARFLVDHGAVLHRTNNEGISPIEHLQEDFPDVADYLRTLGAETAAAAATTTSPPAPSEHQQNLTSEQLTSSLLVSVHDIMLRAEAEGRDPDEELRRAVGRTVLEGMVAGYEMGGAVADERAVEDTPRKRTRTDGPGE